MTDAQHLPQPPEEGRVSEKAPLWKRLLPIVFGLAVVVFLFGWVLPQFIDYEAVFRAIGTISAVEWVILIVVALLRFIPEGWVYRAAQPGLSIGQGTQLFLVSETLTNIPPGGLDLVARYQMSKSWGFSTGEATSATIASWVFTALSKLILPIAAVLFLAIRRVGDDDLDLLAIIAFVVVAVGALVLYLVLRSPDLAARIGEMLGRVVRWVSGIFRREVQTDFRQLVLEFREESSALLRQQTAIGTIAGVTARVASFLVLFLALRFVGITTDQLHWTVAFAAFAVTMAITVIPIFNMPGIAEAVLIATFNAAAGGGAADQVAAAVFVYRILTWLTPIPFGGLAFTRWRNEMRASGKTELLDAFDDPDASPETA
jgi:uncharacterized membrane protein YbhN (UPF0104 family)